MDKEMAQLFKALSDPNRLKIIRLLLEGETCGCTLIDSLPVSQPTMSYHLRMLAEAGIISSHKDGTWNKHKVNKDKITEIENYLKGLLETKTSCKL